MTTQDEITAAKMELQRIEEAAIVAQAALGIEPDDGTLPGQVREAARSLDEARRQHDFLQGRADELTAYIAEHQKISADIRRQINELPAPAALAGPAGEVTTATAVTAGLTDADERDAALANAAAAEETRALEEKRAALQEQMVREDRLVTDAQTARDEFETQRDASGDTATDLEAQLGALLSQVQQAAVDQKSAVDAAEASAGIAHENAERCGAAIAIDGVRVLCQRESGHHVDAYDRHKCVIVANGAEDANMPKTDPAVHCAIVWNEPGTEVVR